MTVLTKISSWLLMAGMAAGMLVLPSCATISDVPKTGTSRNMAFLYNPSSSPLHPEFTIYHEGSNYSRLYVKLFPVELLFNQANPEGTYQSKLKVRYELYEIIDKKENKQISDSSTIVYQLKMAEVKNAFIASIQFKSGLNKMYLMKVYTTDLLRNKGTVNFLIVNRRTENMAQNYRVLTYASAMPSFDRIFHSGEIFKVQYNGSGLDQLVIKYFKDQTPLPRPPVTNIQSPRPDFIPDSIFAYPYTDSTHYILSRMGMYHVQADPRQPDGLTVYNFGDNFPRVTTVDEMIGPLAYLTSAVEFNELAAQTNRKLAVDNFWLESAGNTERARELIRIYYNRVFFANYYFSSYKEGWKTDRGMMFVIYGPPNNMSKSATSETWTYYRKKSREPLRFTFNRIENPYSENDYALLRSFTNSLWMQAVQDWRNGKVFYADN